jgi:hypothetical protein
MSHNQCRGRRDVTTERIWSTAVTSESCHPLGGLTIPHGMGAITAVHCLVLDLRWSLEDPKGCRQTCGTGSNSPQIRGWYVGLGPHCIRGDINGRPMGDSSLCDEMAPRARSHMFACQKLNVFHRPKTFYT